MPHLKTCDFTGANALIYRTEKTKAWILTVVLKIGAICYD